jgi:hypothetical protein
MVALGALGVGYAMWSDTVVINGTVNTGSVDIVVEELSSTYVYKVVGFDGYQTPDGRFYNHRAMICWRVNDTNDQPYDAPLPADAAILLVAYAETTATGDDNQTITMEFDNLFPTETCDIIGDVVLHYIGTIPAHVGYDLVWSGDALLQNYVVLDWDLQYGPNNPAGAQGTWEMDLTEEEMGLLQLHSSDHLYLDIYFDIPQEDESMLLDGRFDMKLVVHQWNENLPANPADWP